MKVKKLKNKTSVLVLGESATALYAIRELGKNNVDVYLESNLKSFVKKSKYVSNKAVSPRENRVQALLDLKHNHITSPTLLIPCSDQDLEFVFNNRTELSKSFYIQDSILDGTAIELMDKEKLYQLCIDKGVSTPACWVVEINELENLIKKIKFPCILKPTLIHNVKKEMAGKKLWTIESESEFYKVINILPTGNTSWVVQELIPGPDSNIRLYAAYFDRNGIATQVYSATKLRQYPPGFGSASLVESKRCEDIEFICNNLLTSISYKGIVAAEFKVDPRDGALKMIEINPRPSLWFSITTASNKLISLAASYDITLSSPIVDKTQAENVIWRYYAKDLFSSIFYKVNRNFILPNPQLPNQMEKCNYVYAIYDQSDIKPLFFEIASLLVKLKNRIFSG